MPASSAVARSSATRARAHGPRRRRQPLRPEPERRQRRQRLRARIRSKRGSSLLGSSAQATPSAASHCRSASRRTPSSGRSQRMPSASVTGSIPLSPSTPEPRASRITTVSA